MSVPRSLCHGEARGRPWRACRPGANTVDMNTVQPAESMSFQSSKLNSVQIVSHHASLPVSPRPPLQPQHVTVTTVTVKVRAARRRVHQCQAVRRRVTVPARPGSSMVVSVERDSESQSEPSPRAACQWPEPRPLAPGPARPGTQWLRH